MSWTEEQHNITRINLVVCFYVINIIAEYSVWTFITMYKACIYLLFSTCLITETHYKITKGGSVKGQMK